MANQLVYSPNNTNTSIFSTETGTSAGTLSELLPAALVGNFGYFRGNDGSDLDGIALAEDTVDWTFTGDSSGFSFPIAVNQYVIVGSEEGHVYAVDGTSGTQVWMQSPGGQITGLSAGDGLLVVFDENADETDGTLIAYTLSTNP